MTNLSRHRITPHPATDMLLNLTMGTNQEKPLPELPDSRLLKGEFNINRSRIQPRDHSNSKQNKVINSSMLEYSNKMRSLKTDNTNLKRLSYSTRNDGLHAMAMRPFLKPVPKISSTMFSTDNLLSNKSYSDDSIVSQRKDEQRKRRHTIPTCSTYESPRTKDSKMDMNERKENETTDGLGDNGVLGKKVHFKLIPSNDSIKTPSPRTDEKIKTSLTSTYTTTSTTDSVKSDQRIVCAKIIPSKNGRDKQKEITLPLDKEQRLEATKEMLRSAINKLKDMERKIRDPLAHIPRIRKSKRIQFEKTKLSVILESDSENDDRSQSSSRTSLAVPDVDENEATDPDAVIESEVVYPDPDGSDQIGYGTILPPITSKQYDAMIDTLSYESHSRTTRRGLHVKAKQKRKKTNIRYLKQEV